MSPHTCHCVRCAAPQGGRPGRAARGFTLVELLVALFALSVMAALSWRGLDGMVRAQTLTQARADDVLALQVALAQWEADLDAVVQLPQQAALDWNGRVLRITRRGAGGVTDGVRVVAWARRVDNGRGTWLRWQSPPLVTRGQVEEAWLRADTWAQNAGTAERAREVAVAPLDEWQIFYFRGDAWTNPLSSDAPGTASRSPAPTGAAPAASAGTGAGVLPDGVRLVLSLPAGQPVAGQVTVDWVSPRVAGGKS